MEDMNVTQAINTADEQLQHVKGVIEALLFVNERPVTIEQIKKVLETVGTSEIKKAIASLQDGHEDRKSGMMIVEIAGGYQMLSNPAYASYLRCFYKTKHKEKLSKPALETLAIIAYKQPVTRSDVELIRGVNSDGVVTNLLEKELIKIIGRKDVPGRPYVYGTTKQFLEYFGLKSLDDLPTLEEFPTLQPAAESDIIPLEEGEVLTAETHINETESEGEMTHVMEPENDGRQPPEIETLHDDQEQAQEVPSSEKEVEQIETAENINRLRDELTGNQAEMTHDLTREAQKQGEPYESEESTQKN